MKALRGRLSGLAQPTYVLDLPGGAGKVPLTPSFKEEGVFSSPLDRSLNRHPDLP